MVLGCGDDGAGGDSSSKSDQFGGDEDANTAPNNTTNNPANNTTSNNPTACGDTREHFIREVWSTTLAPVCMSCHQPGGLANETGARFVVLPSSYPGFIDTNMASLEAIARLQYDGVSQVLLKPTGAVSHGGGALIAPDGPEIAALKVFVDRLDQQELPPCDTNSPTIADAGATLLTPSQTFRKATLHLAGRLPTETELSAIEDGGEAALEAALLEMMGEEGFLEHLKELWNNILLTDRYLSYRGHALQLLRYGGDFPEIESWFDTLDDATQTLVNRAVAREPLELIAHIVRNDRPFSEVITADYTVFNPYSAPIYNTDLTFDDPTNSEEWREGQITIQRSGETVTHPHAGVLSSPMFLNRFPTTPTNRNRGRSRVVLQNFLATDILKAAERPIDPTASTAYLNPTRDDSNCSVCHQMIDPVAGGFQRFDDNNNDRYDPDRQWYSDMVPPGFGDEIMPVSEFDNALSWVAERIVADPRFALSMARLMNEGLTGRVPLRFPQDFDAADFTAQRQAWEQQDAHFRSLIKRFDDNDQNLKHLMVGILTGPYYRAVAIEGTPSEENTPLLNSLGSMRLLGPERLTRKIEATTGYRWERSWDQQSYLETDFRILYGGINSDTVTKRLSTPNAMIASVAQRMANEVSCAATTRDLLRTPDQRHLLPEVEQSDRPRTSSGEDDPVAIEKIKRNIQHLHRHLLGESLAIDDPEIERTYTLFLNVWSHGIDALAADEESDWMNWRCGTDTHPDTLLLLPEELHIRTDPEYTIRAWRAVVAYLLGDARFLFDE